MTGSRPQGLRSESGASFVAVLVAMLLAGALYFGYFKGGETVGERSVGIAAIDGSRKFACRMNRQTIERQIKSWMASHEGDVPTLDELDEDVGPLATCPEGGYYSLDGTSVACSEHR
jgi:hypothetical protein